MGCQICTISELGQVYVYLLELRQNRRVSLMISSDMVVYII